MISCGVSLLYSSFGMSKDKREARLKTPYVDDACGRAGLWRRAAWKSHAPCRHSVTARPMPTPDPHPRSVSKIVQDVTKKPLEPHVKRLVLELCCDDKEGEDVEVPYVLYRLP